MIRIILVCCEGMSTSMLVKKMMESAELKDIDASIEAIAEGALASKGEGADVILLGPQVRYLLKKTKAEYEPKGVNVGVIDMVDYGRMNGEKVLAYAIDLRKG